MWVNNEFPQPSIPFYCGQANSGNSNGIGWEKAGLALNSQLPMTEVRGLATGRRHGRYSSVYGTRYNRLVDFGEQPLPVTSHDGTALAIRAGAYAVQPSVSLPNLSGNPRLNPCKPWGFSEEKASNEYKSLAIHPTSEEGGLPCDRIVKRLPSTVHVVHVLKHARSRSDEFRRYARDGI